MSKSEILIAITGASGSIYAKMIFKVLKKHNISFDLIASENGISVYNYELNEQLDQSGSGASNIFNNNDMYTRAASGSNPYKAMIIIPASMGTIGKAASGVTDNLINRAIDVSLKEERRTIFCFRETPLNTIHLDNLLKLKRSGGSIFPLSPSFYFDQKSNNEVVENLIFRVLSLAGYDLNEKRRWG